MIVCAASNNAGKLKELRRILERMGHEVKSLRELGINLDPEETGTTFAENARIKAEAFCKASGLPGRIAFTLQSGDYGFGYDPLFIPDEYGAPDGKRPNTERRSYAQLTPDEKDAISHRGRAMEKLEAELPTFLG